MTLPWWLNPWAEVRRLRLHLSEWGDATDHWIVRWRGECVKRRAFENENAELKRQIAQMEKGSRRAGAQTDEEILSRFVGAHAEKSYPRFKHSRSVTPGRRFKI